MSRFLVSPSPLLHASGNRNNFTRATGEADSERGSRTLASKYSSGLEMLSFDWRDEEQEGKAENISEKTRNMLRRKRKN